MKTVEYWEVRDNFSEDGMNPCSERILGYLSTEAMARDYARGRGNWGHDAKVVYHLMVICDTLKEMKEWQLACTREVALAKLTKEEREALCV